MIHTIDHRPPSMDHRPLTIDHWPPSMDHGLVILIFCFGASMIHTIDHRPPSMDHRPLTIDHWPPSMDHGLACACRVARAFWLEFRPWGAALVVLGPRPLCWTSVTAGLRPQTWTFVCQAYTASVRFATIALGISPTGGPLGRTGYLGQLPTPSPCCTSIPWGQQAPCRTRWWGGYSLRHRRHYHHHHLQSGTRGCRRCHGAALSSAPNSVRPSWPWLGVF